MTSTTKKVVAGTATAIAVATGVFVANYESTDNSIDWNSIMPSIDSYMPEMPDLGLNILPTLQFNTLEQLPTLDDSFKTPETIVEGTNQIEISDSFGTIDTIPSFIVSSVLQNYENDFKIESLDVKINDSGLTIANIVFSIPEYGTMSLSIPFEQYDLDLINNAIKWKKIQEYFQDKRNVEHDYNILSNEYINKWLKIYEDYRSKSFQKIALTKSFRMISEVKVPSNNYQLDILNKNLSYYKQRGYDSVLIVFDGSEEPRDLMNLVKYIRYKGFRAFFAFGGNEDLNISVFVNPEKLKNQLQALALYSEGFLLGWRRTSAHLIEQDIQYMNYMSECVRNANENCLIFGEVYYGNTAKYPHHNQWGFGYNLPNYASAAVICNFGVESVNAEGVVKYLIPHKIGKIFEQVAVITGQRPYYLTVYRNGLSQEENQKIKEQIEKRFINSGCKGTITLHDDGRNGIGGYQTNNNLSETIYSSLK